MTSDKAPRGLRTVGLAQVLDRRDNETIPTRDRAFAKEVQDARRQNARIVSDLAADPPGQQERRRERSSVVANFQSSVVYLG
jgi:hypothetical protein